MPLSSEQARQNALIGGGRPKGSVSEQTKLKLKTESLLRRRIFRMADKLISAQAVVAVGTHKMVVLSVDAEGKKHVETIRDEKRMQELLDTGVYGRDYIIIAGAEPDWKAANALLDRAYGKAKESMQLDIEAKFSLKGLAEFREQVRSRDISTPELEAPEESK